MFITSNISHRALVRDTEAHVVDGFPKRKSKLLLYHLASYPSVVGLPKGNPRFSSASSTQSLGFAVVGKPLGDHLGEENSYRMSDKSNVSIFAIGVIRPFFALLGAPLSIPPLRLALSPPNTRVTICMVIICMVIIYMVI